MTARLLLVVLVAGILLGSAHPAGALPSAVSPTPHPSGHAAASPSPSASPSVDATPKKPSWWDIPGRVNYAIKQWFADLVASAIKPVFGLLGRTAFATPDFAANPRIVSLWRVSLGLADALMILFVLVGAGILMAGTSLASQTTAKQLLPRIVLAALGSHLSLVILAQLTGISNALSRAMLGAEIDPASLAHRMSALLTQRILGNVFLTLLALVVVVLGVLVLIAYIVRIAVLVVLAAAAPLLLIGHTLPQTEDMAAAWWRGLIALLAAPVLQSLILTTAVRVFMGGGSVVGLGAGSGLIDLLVIGCLLYLLYKVPFVALRRALGKRYGKLTQAGATMRIVAARTLLR